MPGNEQWCQHKGWPKDRPVEEKLIESWEELSEWSSNDHFNALSNCKNCIIFVVYSGAT